jgi:hypothetical protein
VETQVVSRQTALRVYASERVRVVSLLGPVTVVAGIIWAIIQPYRLTVLHPHHQGFWWLAIEPPLLVAAAGVFFALVVARPLVADLEGQHGAP